jgi:hypothetical protein
MLDESPVRGAKAVPSGPLFYLGSVLAGGPAGADVIEAPAVLGRCARSLVLREASVTTIVAPGEAWRRRNDDVVLEHRETF